MAPTLARRPSSGIPATLFPDAARYMDNISCLRQTLAQGETPGMFAQVNRYK
jgi:hypothetical protein